MTDIVERCEHGIRWPHPCDDCEAEALKPHNLIAQIEARDAIALCFEGDLPNGLINRIYAALSALPTVGGWLDIAGIPDAQQVEVLMQDCECGQFVMLATLYDRDAPMSFLNEDGDYFPPDQNGCWPTHFRFKTWPLPTPPEIE